LQKTDIRGLAAALFAYGTWGILPLYFSQLAAASSLEIFAHRVFWSILFLGLLTFANGTLRQTLAELRSRTMFLTILFSSLMIGSNWLIYAYAIITHQTLEASLGYFINPLFTALLGRFLLKERLEFFHLVAFGFGFLGVLWQLFFLGHFPWISLTLAITFGLYGLAKKRMAMSSVQALFLEAVMLLPLAAALLGTVALEHHLVFRFDLSKVSLMLVGLGIITSVPLAAFGVAAQRLPMLVMGVCQYLSPSLKFIVAITVLGETLDHQKLASYILVWIGVVIFVGGSWQKSRRQSLTAKPSDSAV
jgi:chloramphenicol-sensitive protein RarD